MKVVQAIWICILLAILTLFVISMAGCTAAWPQCSQTVKVPIKQQYVQPEQVIVNSYCVDYVGDQERT